MKTVLITLLIIVIGIAGILAYYGAFTKVEIKEQTIENTYFVYGVYIGEYSKVKEPMDKLYNKLLNEEKLQTTKGLGIYYDNPKNVESSKLRTVYGCVVDTKDVNRLEALKTKGYHVGLLRKSKAVVADFPFNGQLSIIIGIFRAYPELDKYQKANSIPGKPIIEIYDMPNKKITYIVPYEIPDDELLGLLKVN